VTTPTHIVDGRGTKSRACVTSVGQLVVSSFAYDDTVFKELSSDDTAFNFYDPKAGEQFVITGIRIKADRFVSNTVDADVIVYEASTDETITVDKILFQEALIRGEAATLIPINILVNEGKFINAKSSDSSIFITIMGYFIPVLTQGTT